jgi:hypothetical protein
MCTIAQCQFAAVVQSLWLLLQQTFAMQLHIALLQAIYVLVLLFSVFYDALLVQIIIQAFVDIRNLSELVSTQRYLTYSNCVD